MRLGPDARVLAFLVFVFPLALHADEGRGGGGNRTELEENDRGELAERAERIREREKEFVRRFGVSRNEMFRRAMAIGSRERQAERMRARRNPLAAGPVWVSLGPTDAPTSSAIGPALSDSGLIDGIALHPTDPKTLYVAPAGGGVWRTTDGGATWKALTDDIGSTAVGALAMAPSDPKRLYAGCGSGPQGLFVGTPPGPGLLVTSDGGDTWRLSATSPGGYFWFLRVSPSDPNTVLAGTDQGLFRTTDGGDSWTRTLAAAGAAWATGLDAQPGNPSVLLATTFRFSISGESFVSGACVANDPSDPVIGGRLWKSTDGGVTWTEKGTLPGGDAAIRRSRISVAFAPSSPNLAYALIGRSTVDGNGCATWSFAHFGDLYDVAVSSDGGETWSALGAGGAGSTLRGILTSPGSIQLDYNNVVSVDPRDAKRVWVGARDVASSADGGLTWSRATSDGGVGGAPYVHVDQHVHAWSKDGSILYLGNDGGIFSTTDGGKTFNDLNKGLVTFQFYTVCQTPAAPVHVMGGTQDNGTSLTKGGSVWTQVIGGDGGECAMHPSNPLLAIGSGPNNTYYRTQNGGDAWTGSQIATSAPDSPMTFPFIRLHPANPNHLYTLTTLRLWHSGDFGSTWSPRSGVIPNTLSIHDFSFFPGDPNRMIMGIDGGVVLVSTDAGATWNQAGATPLHGIYSVRFDATDPNTLFVSNIVTIPGVEHVYTSVDGGATWTGLSHTGQPNGLPDLPVLQIEQDPNDRKVLYAMSSVGVYRTGDGGATWQRFGQGLPNVWPYQMAVMPDRSKMRLATFGRGVWEISLAALPPDQPPAAAIDVPASSPTLDAGIPAAFHGVATDPDAGDVLTVSWDFGDATPAATSAGASHAFAVPGTYTVTFKVTDQAGLSATATRNVTVRVPQGDVATGPELLLPVVLDVVGAGGSHYTTELTLISRAATPTTVLLQYTGSVGGGSGYASVTLQPGEVRLIPDAIAFLATAGLPLAAGGTRIGTLRAVFSGGATASDVFIGGRTSTPGAGGTFGLFYTGTATSTTTATVFGLQQNAVQRSNLALVNAGSDPITLRVQLQGPNGESLSNPGDQALPGYGWTQLNQPLLGQAESGRAVVTKLSGASPFTAYGVLNDAATSDGSFIPALVPGDATGADRLVPIVISAAGYQSEITLTNFASQPMPLTLTYTGSPQLSASGSGSAPLTLQPGEQKILPDSMTFLRNLGLPIPSSGNVGGSLVVKAPAGTPASSLAAGARTFTNAAGGGTYGLFYPGLTLGESATALAYVNGLQQNAGQRSNLAIVNRGDASDSITLMVTYYGADGSLLAGPDTATLASGEWKQFNQPLAARGASAGFAKVERLSGASRFVAYGILNDQHNSDGSYIPMSR